MELDKLIEELKDRNIKKVFVQLPEGLINKYEEIARKFEEYGITPLISIETTYGYCDVRDEEAVRLGCEAVIHFGHNVFGFENMKTEIPVYVVEWFIDSDYMKVFEKILEKINKEEKVGIAHSLQYRRVSEKIYKELENKGIKVEILGQVLGCNILNIMKKEVDKIFIISAGKFYGIFSCLKSDKKIYLVDLEKNEVLDLKSYIEKIVKIKEWNKKVFKEEKKIGLLVSWKKGQLRDWEFFYEKLKKMGKDVYILVFDELEEKMLEGIKVDILINLACPRIGIDDIDRFKIPILNPEDIF
ncbi:MAG: diphthamide biosynthesis enzyme Dph2 [Candidatus Aenigmatarchaeota archaeon]